MCNGRGGGRRPSGGGGGAAAAGLFAPPSADEEDLGLSQDDDAHALHLILEDDVEFAGDFAERWADLGRRLKADYSWDLVHLGVLDDRNLYDDSPVEGVPGARRFSAAQRSFGAGAFAYVIRPRTARWRARRAPRSLARPSRRRPSRRGESSLQSRAWAWRRCAARCRRLRCARVCVTTAACRLMGESGVAANARTGGALPR